MGSTENHKKIIEMLLYSFFAHEFTFVNGRMKQNGYCIRLKFGVLKFRFTALTEGICASLNSRIQALKLNRIHAGFYLKDVILALSLGAQN